MNYLDLPWSCLRPQGNTIYVLLARVHNKELMNYCVYKCQFDVDIHYGIYTASYWLISNSKCNYMY